MVFEHCIVHCTEESLCVGLFLILPSAVAVMHRSGPLTYTAIGSDSEMSLARFLAHRFYARLRNSGSQPDLVNGVSAALENLNLFQTQSQNLIATGRLKIASQGFRVKAVGHDRARGTVLAEPRSIPSIYRE
jgi:hypothetical protein